MSNHAFKHDLKALRRELEELQETLEDLGESGSEAARQALTEMKGKLEAKLGTIFSSLKDTSHDVTGRSKSFFGDAEHESRRFLKRAEHGGKGAFYEAEHETKGRTTATSLAVFGLGFVVGWLVARR